jgi:hypothetical protein
MIAGTDRPTPGERQGATDCLVELALAWLQRPLAGLSDAERGRAYEEICLVISQMRHRHPEIMDPERRSWVERVAARICRELPGLAGQQQTARLHLEQHVTVALLTYHDWREKIAPVVPQRAASGRADGPDNEVPA